MRQQLPDGCIRLRYVRFEVADAIVQREAALFNTAKQVRSGKQLSESVDVKWRVRPCREGSVDVLAAERLFPDDVVAADDCHGQSRYTGLNAKRLDVVANQLEDWRIGLRARPCRHQEHDADNRGEQDPMHPMSCQTSVYHPCRFKWIRATE